MEFGEEQGIKLGKEQGIELGEKRKALKVAKSLLAIFPTDNQKIAELTGLTVEEVNVLRSDQDKKLGSE